jgi:hypothetical protein
MWKWFLWICAGGIAAYLAWWIVPNYLRGREDPRSAAHLGKVAAEIYFDKDKQPVAAVDVTAKDCGF